MISKDKARQAVTSCCGSEKDSFDCAAMMEKLKDCCDSGKQGENASCCPDAMQACCESPEAAQS